LVSFFLIVIVFLSEIFFHITNLLDMQIPMLIAAFKFFSLISELSK
jgi:hypothetical protein